MVLSPTVLCISLTIVLLFLPFQFGFHSEIFSEWIFFSALEKLFGTNFNICVKLGKPSKTQHLFILNRATAAVGFCTGTDSWHYAIIPCTF